MQVTTPNPWMPRLSAFVTALLLSGSVVYWFLHWPTTTQGSGAVAVASDAEVPPLSPDVLAHLLGGEAAPVAGAPADASSRFRLTGIIASGAGQGVALISIDGKPPKPYRVGSALENGLMLQSVEQRRVALASDVKGPVRMRLELPGRQP